MCMQVGIINEFDIPIHPSLICMERRPSSCSDVVLVLWSLDDYWYYSAFTLLMLMFFEGMLCKQRLDGLLMLRNMRRPSIPIQVYRGGGWKLMTPKDLCPGISSPSLHTNSKRMSSFKSNNWAIMVRRWY